MTTTDVNFIDNPAAKNDFCQITIDSAKALKSWKKSVYSYEWLRKDGSIKSIPELSPAEQTKRIAAEKSIAANTPLPKPILGIGIMNNIEIGSGRAELLTLIDQGHATIPVHVPTTQQADFTTFLATPAAEKGNILFYILIAVGLLAALSYTIAGTSQNRVSGISEERASLLATELISTANRLAESTAKLRLNGCADTQISFETSKLADHINTNAPTDESCHIYKINAGGLNYQPLNSEAGPAPSWLFTGEVEINQIGLTDGNDTGNELIVLGKNLHENICEKINELSSVTNPIASHNLASPDDWEGSYNYITTINTTSLSGKRSGCFLDTDTDEYTFYRVLISR